jgi:hypothetical protein
MIGQTDYRLNGELSDRRMPTDRQTDSQTDRQTNRKVGRETETNEQIN